MPETRAEHSSAPQHSEHGSTLADELFAELRDLPVLMSVPQAAKVLNWSPRTYYERALRGEVPPRMVGGRRFVPKAMLLEWLGVMPK